MACLRQTKRCSAAGDRETSACLTSLTNSAGLPTCEQSGNSSHSNRNSHGLPRMPFDEMRRVFNTIFHRNKASFERALCFVFPLFDDVIDQYLRLFNLVC